MKELSTKTIAMLEGESIFTNSIFNENKKGFTIFCKAFFQCGEYRSRTDDLLHAMLFSRLFFTF